MRQLDSTAGENELRKCEIASQDNQITIEYEELNACILLWPMQVSAGSLLRCLDLSPPNNRQLDAAAAAAANNNNKQLNRAMMTTTL